MKISEHHIEFNKICDMLYMMQFRALCELGFIVNQYV